MRNSWLEKYTGSEHRTPKNWANIAVGIVAASALGIMVAGSMWVQMKDSESAMHEISASHARSFRHSFKEKTTSLLALAIPAKTDAIGQAVSEDEEAFALQSISDLEAASEGDKLDPFSPLVSAGGDQGIDPTKPKDVLDDVQFTGFINDAKAKDKVAIIRVAAAGGSKSLIRKVGESFYAGDQKIVVKDIKSGTLYLSVNGASRSLELTPYEDTVAASSGGGAGASTPAPATATPPSGSGSGNSSLNLEEL